MRVQARTTCAAEGRRLVCGGGDEQQDAGILVVQLEHGERPDGKQRESQISPTRPFDERPQPCRR
jgi:hypothetical protein